MGSRVNANRSIRVSAVLGLHALLCGALPGPVLVHTEAATNSPALPAAMRLEESIWRDEILGDVNGALRGYRALLETERLPDRLKAETLYQLAFALALKGNPDKAVETLIQVVDGFPGLEPFALYASQGIRILSPDAAKRGRQWQHDEVVRIGDLAIALDGAVSRTEIQDSIGILTDLQASIEVLVSQLADGPERTLWDSRAQKLGEVRRLLADARMAEVRGLWNGADLSGSLSRRDGLFDAEDFSAWIVGRRDAFARALQRGDVSGMGTEAEPLRRFASRMGERVEDSSARQYARFLAKAVTLVETLARQGRFAEARAQLRRTDRALDRAYGAYHLQVPGLTTFPEDLRPELVRILTGVEATLERLDDPKPEAAAAPSLAWSIDQIEALLPSVTDLPSQQRLAQWRADFEAARSALDAGQSERARKILQTYEF